jgi:hypothetical protein
MIQSINGLNNWLSRLNPDSVGDKRRPHMFDKIDENGDGTIDETEMQAFVSRLEEKTGKTIDGKKLFTTVDTNEDGLIDEEEFWAGREKAKDLLGPINHPIGTGKKADDFSSILIDMLANEETDEESLLTNDQYGRLVNLYLGNYINNGDADQDNPFDILA